MGYWSYVEQAAGMGRYYGWVLLGVVVASLVLGALAPGTRLRLRAAVVMLGVSFLGMLVCAILPYRGVLATDSTGYRWIHFAAQFLFTIAVINVASVLLFRVLLEPVKLEPAPILRDTLLGLSYVLAALMLLGRHGVNLSGIVATSAVVTAVIGFSLQDTLGNIMGGVALQVERSIAVGDWIKVGEVEGLVREIRWRQTSIETRNWDTVVIPNSALMKSQVTVLGRRVGKPKQRRMTIDFNVDLRTAPGDVIETVEQALRAERIPNVAVEPPPNCVLREFKDGDAHYSVRYWLTDFERDTSTSSEVRARIFVAMKRNGISIAMPSQSILMTLESRSREQRKQQEEVRRRVESLKGVAILQPLTEQEREELAARLSVAPFRRGEIITRQGNVAHYLYVISKGEVEVRIAANGDNRAVARLRAGDVFGEMGLMTGEPRSATVVAMTDAICYRLDKDAFNDALQRRPEIAEAISHLLAKRKVELDALTQGLNAEAMKQHVSLAQNELLVRIRKFFTLG